MTSRSDQRIARLVRKGAQHIPAKVPGILDSDLLMQRANRAAHDAVKKLRSEEAGKARSRGLMERSDRRSQSQSLAGLLVQFGRNEKVATFSRKHDPPSCAVQNESCRKRSIEELAKLFEDYP
jgi:hypothetical protein